MSRWSNSYELALILIIYWLACIYNQTTCNLIFYSFFPFQGCVFIDNFFLKLFACSIIWYRGTCIKNIPNITKISCGKFYYRNTRGNFDLYIFLKHFVNILFLFLYNNTYHMTIFILVLRSSLQKTDSRAVLSKIN